METMETIKNGVIINGSVYELLERDYVENACKNCDLTEFCHLLTDDIELCEIISETAGLKDWSLFRKVDKPKSVSTKQ